MRAELLATFLATACLTGAGSAQTVRTLLNNGPTSNRYDIVMIGDGYTAAEQARFDSNAVSVATALFQKEPYRTFGQYLNVHTVFRPSLQSGANHPDVNPPIVRNPVYGATYNYGGTPRCLYITNGSLALQDAALAPANEGRVIVLVNDSRYGGCAATFSVSYNGSSMNEVQVHELGHSVGQLADEYDYPNGTYSGPEPGQANVTASNTGQKWSLWLGSNSIGVYEGARYYRYGLFRPKHNCLMRSLGTAHCAVCQEQISKVANSVVSAIDQPSPVQTSLTLAIGAQQAFSFTNLVPPANGSVITWKLDGAVQAPTGTSFLLDTANLALGNHTVKVEVDDQTTLVRNDPAALMTHERTWNVLVNDPTVPDLVAQSVTTNVVFVVPGQNIDITTTVHNAGIAAAGTFVVEHFLSRDILVTNDDLYLGSYTVSSLPGGQSSVQVRTNVKLPYVTPRLANYVIAAVDRLDHVREQHEDNNLSVGVVWINNPPCHTSLEYRDDFLYPRDSQEISMLNGGIALPTVVAPCASPGTQYLIVWGCSGTTPGTTIAPGITVPINQDPCTQLGLGALNGSEFQAFWGTLDSAGVGRATFNWPGGLVTSPFTGYFAAILIDGTPQFTATTNPIAIHFR